MASRITASAVAQRLRQARGNLTKEVKELNHRTLTRQLPRHFRFVESGSFWSPLLDDITDIDLMYLVRNKRASANHSIILIENAESLRNVAAQVMHTTLKYRIVITEGDSSNRIEEEHEDWASCLKMMQVCNPIVLTLHFSARCTGSARMAEGGEPVHL